MLIRCMKYIVVEDGGFDHIFIFPQYLEHRDFTAYLNVKPIRAGFVHLCDGKLRCYGESLGLNLRSDPDKDTKLLNRNIDFDYEP